MATLLRVTGIGMRPLDFDFEALAALPGQEPDIAVLIPGRQGGGVRLSSLLRHIAAPEAAYITLESTDGFRASVPLAPIRDQGLIVYRKGAETLPGSDGGPLRFLIIDVETCGMDDPTASESIDRCANVKRLARLHLSAQPGTDTRPSTKRAHDALHMCEAEV